MGLASTIGAIGRTLFGSNRNAIAETAEVFIANAENNAARAAEIDHATLAQYAAEFHTRNNRTLFDSIVDGLNRLVRPTVTLGLLLPIPATIIDPDGMRTVWLSLSLLPEMYWALLFAVIPFYFSGRMQIKGQDFNRSMQEAAARAMTYLNNRDVQAPNDGVDDIEESPEEIDVPDVTVPTNDALAAWQSEKKG